MTRRERALGTLHVLGSRDCPDFGLSAAHRLSAEQFDRALERRAEWLANELLDVLDQAHAQQLITDDLDNLVRRGVEAILPGRLPALPGWLTAELLTAYAPQLTDCAIARWTTIDEDTLAPLRAVARAEHDRRPHLHVDWSLCRAA
jgi:hypothetical protein